MFFLFILPALPRDYPVWRFYFLAVGCICSVQFRGIQLWLGCEVGDSPPLYGVRIILFRFIFNSNLKRRSLLFISSFFTGIRSCCIVSCYLVSDIIPILYWAKLERAFEDFYSFFITCFNVIISLFPLNIIFSFPYVLVVSLLFYGLGTQLAGHEAR